AGRERRRARLRRGRARLCGGRRRSRGGQRAHRRPWDRAADAPPRAVRGSRRAAPAASRRAPPQPAMRLRRRSGRTYTHAAIAEGATKGQRAARRRTRTTVALLLLAAASAFAVPGARSAGGVSPTWGSWGRTLDQTRHSPLKAITKANIDGLGRVFTVDFRTIDPRTRRGEQSYPLVIGDRMYMTTYDDNVWALDATSGKVLWRYRPENTAVFSNFGIVANRGVAYCNGRIFLATLDMYLVALRASDGKQLARVPVASAVPGAASNYGYEQT